MKKVITIISCCIIIFSIGGCMNREKYMSDWFTSEQEEADKMMEQIIEACRKQDTQKLKELFSENSRKNIKNIDKLTPREVERLVTEAMIEEETEN